MMNLHPTLLMTSLAVVVLATVGCGSSPPSLVQVTGEVTSNGAPVEGAQVTFVNDEPSGMPATAVTDASGRFEVETYWNAAKKSFSGAAPGSYTITVSKMEAPTQEEIDRAMAESRSVKRESLIPQKYASARSSGIKHKVTKGGDNHFEIAVD